MTEMKNICGKIPKDLHEKVREEIELTESSTQKFIQQVIEEHFERLAGKGEMSMGTARTIAVQVSEELFQRLKTVIAKKGMKQKDFLIQIIEEALEKAEAEWQNKDSTEEAEPATGESEIEETQPEEENDLEEESEPGEGNQPEEECEPEEETEPEEENELGEESKPDISYPVHRNGFVWHFSDFFQYLRTHLLTIAVLSSFLHFQCFEQDIFLCVHNGQRIFQTLRCMVRRIYMNMLTTGLIDKTSMPPQTAYNFL